MADEDPRGRLRRARLGLPGAGARTCRRRRSTTCCTRSATRNGSSCATGTSGARARTRPTSRGSSPTSSGAYRETESDYIKGEIEKFMVTKPCPTCGGKRLRPEILAVTIGDKNVWDVATMSITDALRWVDRTRPDAQRARADDRLPGAQGDRRAAGFPRRRRSRLPDHGPHERDAVGRRGAADPPGDPDRHDADGRPVHPRRAVDRPPPARQREAHRDADTAARPRQHRARRRARRGDDPDRGLGRRHRPRGGGARRRDRRERHARGAARRAAIDHRRVPARRARGPDPEAPAQGQRQEAGSSRGAREHNLRDIDLKIPSGRSCR